MVLIIKLQGIVMVMVMMVVVVVVVVVRDSG